MSNRETVIFDDGVICRNDLTEALQVFRFRKIASIGYRAPNAVYPGGTLVITPKKGPARAVPLYNPVPAGLIESIENLVVKSGGVKIAE